LLLEVSRLSIEAMLSQPPYPPQNTPEEEIFEFMNSRMEHDVNNKDFVRVILSRALSDPTFHKKLAPTTTSAPVDAVFMDRLKAFKKNGIIRRDIDLDRLFFVTRAFGFSVGVLDRLLWRLPPEECRKRFRFFAESITKGICSQQ